MEEIPEEIKDHVKFVFVDTVDEVLELALDTKKKIKKKRSKAKIKK